MSEMLKQFKQNQLFYKSLFILILPIVLQSLVTSSLNMLDTLMIGSLGELELAAVGVANQYYFFYSMLIMGVSAGCGILVAQLWGKKDEDSIKVVLRYSLIIGVFTSIIFTAIGICFAEQVISLFNNTPEVVAFGASYLRVSAFSYLATSISFVYAGALRSIGNTVLPMWGSFIGLATNGILNVTLIFGLFGAPALGVVGAAIATLMARLVECLLIVTIANQKVEPLKLKISELFKLDKAIGKVLYYTSLPVILNEACWGLANVTYTMIYGQIGVGAIATTQITTTIINLFMIVIFGMAHGTVVVVGNDIGAGLEKQATENASKIIKLSLVIGIFIAASLLFIAPFFVDIYNVSEEVKQNAITILMIFSCFLLLRIYNAILIVGVFRGGGDTKDGSIIQAVSLWGVGSPLAFISAILLKWPVTAVFFLVSCEEIIRFIVLRHRFKSGKWIHNMVQTLN